MMMGGWAPVLLAAALSPQRTTDPVPTAARVTPDAAAGDTQRTPTRPAVQESEYAAEVYYSIHPVVWLEMRPNIQFVHPPGGYAEGNDVTILGLKAAFIL